LLPQRVNPLGGAAAAAIAILVAMTSSTWPASLAGESFLYRSHRLSEHRLDRRSPVFLYDISVSTGDSNHETSVGGISSDRRLCNFSWSRSASVPSSKDAREFGSRCHRRCVHDRLGIQALPRRCASTLIANTAPVAWGRSELP